MQVITTRIHHSAGADELAICMEMFSRFEDSLLTLLVPMSSVLAIMHVYVHTLVLVLVEEAQHSGKKLKVLLLGSIIRVFINPLNSNAYYVSTYSTSKY